MNNCLIERLTSEIALEKMFVFALFTLVELAGFVFMLFCDIYVDFKSFDRRLDSVF